MKNAIAGFLAPWKARSAGTRKGKRRDGARERRRNCLYVELLETRQVLSTITWSTAAAPTGGDWNVGTNWVGGVVPGAGDTATIAGLTGGGTVYLQSGGTNSVAGLTTDSTTTLEIISGSLSLGVGASATLGGPVVVEQGAALNVAGGATVTIGAGQTLTDGGSLSFANGDTVSFPTASNATTQIVVNGTMSATTTKFVNPGNAGGSVNQIYVGTGGELSATNSTFGLNELDLTSGSIVKTSDLTGNTFNLPLYVAAINVPLLANNQSFEAINILSGSLSNGQSTALTLIGTTSTANLSYVFPSGFTVQSGATLTIGAGVSLTIADAQLLSVSGQLTVTNASVVIDRNAGYGGYTDGIQVNSGGTATFTDSTINQSVNGNSEVSQIEIKTGGHLIATGSNFSLLNLDLDDGLVLNEGDLSSNIFNTNLYAPIADIPLLTANQSFNAVYLTGGLNSGQSVTLDPIGTQTTTGQYYVLPSGLTVGSGQALTIEANASLTIADTELLSVSGQLTVTNASVVIDRNAGYGGYTDGIQVNSGGTATFTDSSINQSVNGNSEVSQIEIKTGGHLIASGSNFSLLNLDLDDGLVLNEGDLSSNIFNTNLYAPIADIPLLTANQSFNAVYLTGGLNSGQSVTLDPIGTQTTTGQYYVLPSGLTVGSGQALTIEANASLTIADTELLSVSGQLTVTSASVVIDRNAGYGGYTDGIQVNSGGTATFTDSSINQSVNGNSEVSQIEIKTGGHLIATGSNFSLLNLDLDDGLVLNQGDLSSNIFNTNLYAPIADIPLLTANQSFNAVYLTGGLNSGQSVTLDPIGTQTTTGQYYVLPSGLTVGSGQALTIEANASLTIADTELLSVSGQLTVTNALVVIDRNAGFGGYTDGIQVNSGGTATFTDSSINQSVNGNAEVSVLEVSSGGQLVANNSTINLSTVTLSSGSSAMMTADVLYGQLSVDSNSSISISGVDLSHLGNSSVIATGDPGAKINLTDNYWGTTVPTQIEAKILDNSDDPTRPTVVFSPLVTNGASGVVANSATTTFSPSDQTVNLKATVTDAGGDTISEGTVTFTILNGTQVIGQMTNPAVVSNNIATAVYTIPGNTPAGQYAILANFSGSSDYLPSMDRLHSLTINAAPTTTSPLSVSATYSAGSTQSVTFTANLGSAAGTVNEGSVTFTVLSGGNPVGSSVNGNVTGNSASASYTLLAGTAGGIYTIQAVYTDPLDFTTSTGRSQLTVSAASTTAVPAGGTTTFTEVSGEGISLSANVSSPAGSVNAGSVTFTVLNGSATQIAGPFVMSITNGAAGGNAFLPASTPVGSYVIQAVYDGTSSFAASLPARSTLTVIAAATTTAAVAASTPFNSASQTVPLTASVISTAGAVNEGTVTFTISNGPNPVGTPVSVSVSSGTASANYTLPPDTALGAYTIEAVYTDTGSFAGSSDLTQYLTVTQSTAKKLVLGTPPSSTAKAGVPFTTQPVIYEEDQYGNVETSDNSTVVTVSLAGGAGPLQGALTATVSGGVATFTNLGDNMAETIMLKFSSGSLTPTTSGSIVVSPAAASKLVITQQPSSTGTAGHAFATQPVIYLVDASGNLETSDNTTVVTASLSSGSGPLAGTVTATAVGGIATFTNLVDDTAETISLKFSGDGLTVGPSTNIAVAPAAPFRLTIHTQPSPTATAGQPFATQPVVYEVDQYGNLETGDSSTVLIASLGTGNGPLQGTTSITLVGGIATFTNLANNSAGAMSLVFAGGGLSAGPSNNVSVSPGPASQLVIQTPPYATVVAGNPLTDPILIDEEDQFGNVVTSDSSTVVTASLASGAGTLKGTMTATVSNGVASFDDLENDTAGMLTLQFTDGTLPAVVSAPSRVKPAQAVKVEITRPPGGVVSGNAFALTVAAQDPFNNTDTSYNGPVSVALAGGSAGTLSGTTTAMATNGVATFTDLVDTTSGPITLDASSGSLASGNSGPVTVTPAAPAKLVIQIQPSQTATAGVAFATQPVIFEEDAFGNLLTGDNTTVVTAYLGSGAGTLNGTVAETFVGGVATFSNLSDNTAGTINLQFAGAGLTSIPTVPVLINPAATSKLVILTEPSAAATAGQAFATQPVIAEEDSFGNVETNDNTTLVTATLQTGTGPLDGTTSVAVKGGLATFTNLTDDTVETISLGFAGDGLTTAPSSNIVITPTPSKLVIQLEPSGSATAGQPFAIQPVIFEEDQFGNLVTTDNSTVLTASLSIGDGPLHGTTSVTVVGGVATFSDLSDNTAETISLDFSGDGLIVGPSTNIVVKPATPSTLLIHIQPAGTATAGQAFTRQPVIYEEDRFGNLETGDDNTLVTASLASGAGPLRGTTVLPLSGGVASFTDLADNLAETISLEFTAGIMATPESLSVAVSPAAPSKLVISRPPSTTATAGKPFAAQPVIFEEDQFGNIETGDSTTRVTASLATGAGPLGGTTMETLSAGVATFAGLEDNKAGTIAIDFAGGGFTAGPESVVVSPTVASQLVIATAPSSPATAGLAFAPQPVIDEEDQFGNLETGDSSTVVTASLATGGGPLQGTVTATLADGVATFTNLADDKAETITLTFAGGGLNSVPTGSIVVNAATATKLVVAVAQPGTVTAGAGFGMVVDALDPYGNIDRSFNGTVSVSLASNPNGETLGGTSSVTAIAGVATFPALTVDKPGGSYSLQAASNALTSRTTPTTQVAPSPPTPTASVTITNSKIKKTVSTVITIQYSTIMDSGSAGLPANYEIFTTSIKGKKKKTTRLAPPSVNFVQSTNTVTLTVKGKKNAFPTGGLLTIVASPNGVHSQAGVFVSAGSVSFTITNNAKNITPV